MPTTDLQLDGQHLTLAALAATARGPAVIGLTEASRAAVLRSRAWVVSVLHGERAIYGVNTGFGSLARVRIDPEQTSLLSRNLIRSHAAGVGPDAPDEVVRGMMLLRANALARGASGCTLALVTTLLQMLERGVTPRVPSLGSCGSSGDLAPLSHLGLVVFGEGGNARFEGLKNYQPDLGASVIRDNNKCINCGKCVKVHVKLQLVKLQLATKKMRHAYM